MSENDLEKAVEFLERYCKAGGITSGQLASYRRSCGCAARSIREKKVDGLDRRAVVQAMLGLKWDSNMTQDTAEAHYAAAREATRKWRYLSRQVPMPWGVGVDG